MRVSFIWVWLCSCGSSVFNVVMLVGLVCMVGVRWDMVFFGLW